MTVKHLLALAGVLALSSAALAQPGSKEPPKKEEPKKEAPKAESKEKDIVDTAMGTGKHKILCKLLTAADWVAPLKEKGPFTVFAPTDEAFGKLPPTTVDSWMKPDMKGALANILKYHVIKGAAVKADDVMKMKESTPTVQGGKITIAVKDKKVWLNGDKISVIQPDVMCSNGIIHVIDGVLTPPADMKKEEPKKEEHKKEEPKKGN